MAPALQAAVGQLDGVLPDQRTCHLDADYDSGPTRQTLIQLCFTSEIARKGTPAPLQASRRWLVEHTQSWMNGYRKLRRIIDRDGTIITYYICLAAAFVTVRALIQGARHHYPWDTRSTTKCLK